MTQINFILRTLAIILSVFAFFGKTEAHSTPTQTFRSAWNSNNLVEQRNTSHLLAQDELNSILNQRKPLKSLNPEAFFGQIIDQIGRPEQYFAFSESQSRGSVPATIIARKSPKRVLRPRRSLNH